MFTGLIEAVCRVKSVQQRANGGLLIVDLEELSAGCRNGDSIAINGVCLTVVDLQGSIGSFDLSIETLGRSNLGKLHSSADVNVERAMKPTGRFGGHIVQGHTDGTGCVDSVKRQGEYADIRFAADPYLLEHMVLKGFVAVDGISLTVTSIDNGRFGVAVIPETLRRTTLGTARAGDMVNIETDIIVKIVKKQLEQILPNESLTAEKLRECGF